MPSNYGQRGQNPYDRFMIHPFDYSNWGYIILYLVVILGSLIGNSLFLLVVKKCPPLQRTAHYLFASLAVRDIVATLVVVPFVMDSQAVNLMEWKSGDVTCKLYSFLHVGTLATHAFTLVMILFFLYFWYRKQEAYIADDGQTVVRRNRMHKWAIPLAWVIGLGLAIPAGALAYLSPVSYTDRRQQCAVWDGQGSQQANYWVQLSVTLVSFILPLVLVVFPFLALMMQLCGAREPRLDPPHSRTAATGVGLVFVLIVTRAPLEGYNMMKLFHQSSMGLKVNLSWGTPYAVTAFETDIILNGIVFLSCVLNPILYFALNPDYRTGAKIVWRQLYCNKDPVHQQQQHTFEADKHARSSQQTLQQQQLQQQQQQQQQPHQQQLSKRELKAQQKEQKKIFKQFPGRNRTPPQMRQGEETLLAGNRQPQIIPAQHQQQHHHQQQQQNWWLQQQQQQQQQQMMLQQQQLQQAAAMGYPQQQLMFQQHYPGMVPGQQQMLYPNQQFLDGSFGDRLSPNLPPVFEFEGMKYIDTARVEPKIAYSPEKTPPKTPETPYFQKTPFVNPVVLNTVQFPNPEMQAAAIRESRRGEREPDFELETLDDSPGSTLRTRSRAGGNRPNEDLDESVELLDDSPRTRRRGRTHESEQWNGHHRPESPERPGSRQSQVEIVITGRTRSGQDLCPDGPRSKFEHAV